MSHWNIPPGLRGATPLHRRRCGETEPQPGPLTLLPVARSPSRSHCCGRWWALTPPFHPSPAPCHSLHRCSTAAGGSAFCCGCSHPQVTLRAPPLAVSWGNLVNPLGLTGSREVPLPGRRRRVATAFRLISILAKSRLNLQPRPDRPRL